MILNTAQTGDQPRKKTNHQGIRVFLFRCAGIVHLCAFLSAAFPARAQHDQHYNSIQYGLRGIIMNGSLVAGVNDNSAIFYNPAALSISSDEGLDLSLFAVSFEMGRKKNAFGEGLDARDKNFMVIPGLVTFVKSPFKNNKIKIGAGILTRHSFQNKYTGTYSEDLGGPFRQNDFRYEYAAREFWLSLGIAYQFKHNICIGYSQYFPFRKEKYEHDLNFSVLSDLQTGRLLLQDRETLSINRKHLGGMISKLGFAWFNRWVKIGLTFTTPTYAHFIRSGKVYYRRNLFEADTATNRYALYESKGFYREPFSLTAGIEWSHKGYIIALAMEYYHRVKDHVWSSNRGDTKTNSSNMYLDLVEGRKKVTNVNLGIEIPVNERFSYLGGFRTNFGYNNQPSDYLVPRIHRSYFDIYHVTCGLKVQYGQNRFTVGLDYGFSFNDHLPEVIDLTGNQVSSSATRQASMVYNNITFLITYNFLMDNLKKKAG